MPDGSTPFPIGFGEPQDRNDDLGARYPFVLNELEKPENLGGDKDRTRLALQAYHQSRQDNRVALIDGEDLEGFRCAVLKRNRMRTYFAGVLDDGRIEQVEIYDRGIENEPNPLDIARQAGDWIRNPDRRRQIEDDQDISIEEKDWTSLSPRSARTAYIAREAAFEAANAVGRHVENAQGEERRNAFFHRFSNQVVHSYRQRLGAASAHLMKHLDPEVQKTMRSTAIYKPDYANWLTGKIGRLVETGERSGSIFEGNYSKTRFEHSVDPELGRNRRQAIQAFPALAKSTFSQGKSHEFQEHRREDSLGAVIDNGQPLLPALCQQHQVKPATLRRIQGLTWQKLGRDFFHDPKSHLKLMDRLSPDHVPQTRRGCADLNAVAQAASVHQNVCEGTQDETLKASGGRMDKIAQELEGNPADGINDLHKYLLGKLVAPGILQKMVASGVSHEKALEMTDNLNLYRTDMHTARPLAGQALRPALQASARWHRALARHEADLVTERQHVEWEGLTGPIDLGGGLTAVELTSKKALQTEGAEQDHCVGGYDSEVLRGDSLIYSIRRGDKTLSTVEIALGEDAQGKFTAKVEQNMGFSNKTPSKAAIEAGKALKKHVASVPQEQLDRYDQGLAEERAKLDAKTPLDVAKRNTGYDPFDRKQLEGAWNSLSEYLPKPVRKRGLDAFIDAQQAFITKAVEAREAHTHRGSWER